MERERDKAVGGGGCKSLGLAVLAGGGLTIGLMVAIGGSAWPTAFFVMGGFLLPYLMGRMLYMAGRRRWVRLLSVVGAVAVLWVVAWTGKHPSAKRAFRDVTGVELPAGAEVIRVDRGWFDGPTTIVWFRADAESVHAAMRACDEGMKGTSVEARIVDRPMQTEGSSYADCWSREVSWATCVARWMDEPPAWSRPRYSHWMLRRTALGGHRGVWFFWDEATGEAIVYDGED